MDGINEALIENANVEIEGNLTSQITTEEVAVAGGQVIDGGGRTMIPGLIDSDFHWHKARTGSIRWRRNLESRLRLGPTG